MDLRYVFRCVSVEGGLVWGVLWAESCSFYFVIVKEIVATADHKVEFA